MELKWKALMQADEAERRLGLRDEQNLLDKLQKSDSWALQDRLQQSLDSFDSIKQSLHRDQQTRSLESKQLSDELHRNQRMRSSEFEAQMGEEVVMNVQALGARCSLDLMRKQLDEEGIRALRSEVWTRRRLLALQDEIQTHEWCMDDEQENLRASALNEQLLYHSQCDVEFFRRSKVDMELQLEELEAQLRRARTARKRIMYRAAKQAAFAAGEDKVPLELEPAEQTSHGERSSLLLGQLGVDTDSRRMEGNHSMLGQ